jgi:signal transduction histidine kinase
VESPRRTISRWDVLLAVVLSIAYQIELWRPIWVPIDPTDDTLTDEARWIAAAFGLALTASLAVRRPYPLLGLLLAFPALASSVPGGIDGTPTLTVTLMIVLLSVGSGTRDAVALIGAVGVGGLITTAILHDPDARLDLGDLIQPVLLLGGSWMAGLALRIRHERERSLEAHATALEHAQESRAQAAVADERARIARELHDVVAHAIAVIVVQARGGRAALSNDPGSTREALDAIEATGVQAINEMHRLVGVIRDIDDPATLRPTPGLRDLDRLIGDVRDAGLAVDLAIEGTPVDVAPGVDLSAYRIIQEALTNALRHAGTTTARVRVRYQDDRLDVEISDSGGDASGLVSADQLGLIGMRERAALVGGTLQAEESPDGGFRVRAHLPLATEST